MLDGLECIEIGCSSIKEKTYDFRIESEYYKKEYIELQSILANNSINNLDDGLVDFVSDGTHFTPNYVEKGIPFISAINVKENYFDPDAGYKFIEKNAHYELCKRVHPKPGDILLRKVGVGPRLCCVVPKGAFDFSVFVSVAVIRPRINPYYLSTFINSSYGQKQLLRFNKGISQPDLHLEDIRKLNVPLFSDVFYTSVENIVYNSELKSDYSKQLIRECEEYISDYLCIKTKKINNLNYTIKSVKESFLSSGRMDAEYYQPKYEQLERELATTETLDSLCNLYDSNYIPEDERFYKYIELANVGKSGEISGVEIVNGKCLPTRARRLVKTGQIIVSSIEGSLDSCALITEEYDNSLCSTGFYVIDSAEINSETLLVLFKSEVMQALLKRRCSGTILTAISKEEFLNMPLPQINDSIQKEIAARVQESFALRKKSKDLLEYAKQAVEMAIEQGEDKALEWLESKEI